jgi:predicted RNA binding protein YcfA (HicA-like mRNA interferase family)
MGFHHDELMTTSQVRYIHADGRRTAVPLHTGKDIGQWLVQKILRDIKMTPEEFATYL